MDALLLVLCVVVAIVMMVALVLTGGRGNMRLTVVNEDDERLPNAAVTVSSVTGLTTRRGVWRGQVAAGTPTMRITAPTGVTDPPAYRPFEGKVAVPKEGATMTKVVLAGWSSLTPWGVR